MRASLKDPVTPRSLFAVCGAVGLDVDQVYDSIGGLLAEATVGPDAFDALVETDLFALHGVRAGTLAETIEACRRMIAAFLKAYQVEIDRSDALLVPVFTRFGVPDGQGGSFLRAMAALSFSDYRDALDSRLSDVIVFLSLRSLSAAEAEARRKRARARR